MIIALLDQMREKNTSLEIRLHKLLKAKYGSRSEGVTSEQLSLFMNALEEESAKDEDEKNSDGEVEVPSIPKRKRRKSCFLESGRTGSLC